MKKVDVIDRKDPCENATNIGRHNPERQKNIETRIQEFVRVGQVCTTSADGRTCFPYSL